jgi:hypothetical protein
MKKKFIVLVILTLVVSIILGLVVLQNYIKNENKKSEPTFLETMNGDGIMFIPTGVLFERAPWDYSDDIEKVFKVSSDMKMETFERSVITKNIIRQSYGVLEEIDISRYKDFFKLYDNSGNSSLEFSEKVFLKNNKKAWGVAFYKQSEISTAGFSKRYILFEQNDGLFYIGVAAGSSGKNLKESMHCYVLFETEIVAEDEIKFEDTDLYGSEKRVMYNYIFDFESDGKKEELIIFAGGYDENTGSSTLVFSVFLKGFGALKVENEYVTRYYDTWIYDESYFLEENGELFLCYKYPAGVTKNKISLNKKNNKVIVESHEECINFAQKDPYIGTTAAP